MFGFLATSILLFISTSRADECLGINGACSLKLDEVTLAGAHNTGAGFDGVLRYHNPYIPALSCPYRNQAKSVYEMLNAGIRYLDVDLCYEDRDGFEKGVWTCHKDAYGGPMSKFLQQVDTWMNEPRNRREIVVIHFNRDHEDNRLDLIGKGITTMLEKLWGPSFAALGKISMQSNLNAVIGESVKQNKRIYVFLHSRLQQGRKPYLFHEHYVGYTWHSMAWLGSDGCKDLATKISDNCPKEARRKFVRLDLYLTWGLCNDDLASSCNKHINYATTRCYTNILSSSWTQAKTVNFIVVDYATEGKGLDAVKVAREQTMKYLMSKSG